METLVEAIGLIAGSHSLPLLFAKQARRMGVRKIVAVAFEGETDPGITQLVDNVTWIKVGQLSKMISAFTDRGISQCVMLGKIAPKSLFDIRPDLRAMGILLRLKEKNAHSIFGAIANELKRDGVYLVEATPWLRPLMPGGGFGIGARPTTEQEDDVRYGYRIAKEISRLEIGQCVVVKNGTVLAVEGFEGTDQCLARGGELAGREGGAVAVKVSKQHHDMRFDVPCIGLQTVETCVAARIAVLAFEANKTLVLDQDSIESKAKRYGVSIITVG